MSVRLRRDSVVGKCGNAINEDKAYFSEQVPIAMLKAKLPLPGPQSDRSRRHLSPFNLPMPHARKIPKAP